MSIVTNRRCMAQLPSKSTHSLLWACAPTDSQHEKIYENIILTELIGKGAFGTVYLGQTKINDMPITVAVKIIKNEYNHKTFESLNDEITYSYMMGAQGLAPKIYDAFYFVDVSTLWYTQVIIMEYFEYSGADALEICYSMDVINFLVTQMIELTKQMIFAHGMYCVDVKPGNFVVNDDLTVVKMIDFGRDWCYPNIKLESLGATEHSMFQILLFQLYCLIRKNVERNKRINVSSKDKADLVKSIFCKYMSDDLPYLLRMYYDDKRFTVAHYTGKDADTSVKIARSICSMYKKSKTKTKTKSRTKTKTKSKSPDKIKTSKRTSRNA